MTWESKLTDADSKHVPHHKNTQRNVEKQINIVVECMSI